MKILYFPKENSNDFQIRFMVSNHYFHFRFTGTNILYINNNISVRIYKKKQRSKENDAIEKLYLLLLSYICSINVPFWQLTFMLQFLFDILPNEFRLHFFERPLKIFLFEKKYSSDNVDKLIFYICGILKFSYLLCSLL